MSAPNPEWSGPQWNAWASAPMTREECNERLQQVPEAIRGDVIRHLKTVWAIRKFHNKKAKKREAT